MNFYIQIIASIICGWCLKCIWDDFVRPVKVAILGGNATVQLDPNIPSDTKTPVELAQVLNTSVLAMTLLGQWCEELQISNPRLPEECLTAQQWIQAALNVIEHQVASTQSK